jgi:hypothetical protein
MKHYVFTRFNVKNKNWHEDKGGVAVLTDNWLTHRFELFFNYCLPSVKNQSNQNFKWCVYFDKDTSEAFIKKVDRLRADYPIFHPYYVTDIQHSKRHFIQLIKDEIPLGQNANKEAKIITTRLDNDDAIHADFIEKVQELGKGKADYLIDITKGFQVKISKKNFEVRSRQYKYNPYLSFIEPISEEIKTVLDRPHHKWKTYSKRIDYDKEHLWLQIIHDRNKKNKVSQIRYLTQVSHII